MIPKSIFIAAHTLAERDFYSTYKRLQKNQRRPYNELKAEQDEHLRHLISFAYDNVPFYRDLFKKMKILPKDIRTTEDLEKLPILTKDIIKANWEAFKPANLSLQKYDSRATGGSTGMPMQFRVSHYDRYLSAAINYRGWGYGGFELGDRMVLLAGSSLDVGTKPWVIKRGHEIARNIRKLSSFDMADAEMRDYAGVLNSFKPLYLRGYTSSIWFFAKWLDENNVPVPKLRGVFTTSERLFPNMRKTIGEVFGCPVFDNYGLNDGGVTAFECHEHNGLHIDTERSIMEIVDQDNYQLFEGQGQIVATSLHNFAMPFIRYATGDLATLTEDPCLCGRNYKVLSDIIGREKELLITPAERVVHGAALIGLIYILLESSIYPDMINRIKQYQIIQRVKEKLELRLVCEEPLPDEVLDYIEKLLFDRFDGWQIQFKYVDTIDQTSAGKYKFIINEMIPDARE